MELLEDRLVLSTFVVTSIADSGVGSFRQAILDANGSPNVGGVADRISFNIPGAGQHTIVALTQLPEISEAVQIDGYTQSGAAPADGTTPATINIRLNRTPETSNSDGLIITSAGSTVRGLIITNFLAGIRIDGAGATGNVIAGNWIGTTGAFSAEPTANFRGVLLVDGAANNTIGGAAVADRNVISGNTFTGVELYSAGSGNSILGNFVGTNITGTSSEANRNAGVVLQDSSNNFVGGAAPGAGNVISGNEKSGLVLEYGADGNTVQGNIIGSNVAGDAPIPNLGSGIVVQNSSNNLIGGTSAIERNLISANLEFGILINASVGEGVYHGGNDNRIVGNYVGLDATGLNGFSNGFDAINISDGARNRIGGATVAERNVIAASFEGHAISIIGHLAADNLVQGNFIGTDATGNVALFGADTGTGDSIPGDALVLGFGAHDNLVGGPSAGEANVIVGIRNGVEINQAAANIIESNRIGIGADGVTPLVGVLGSGVFIRFGSDNNVVRQNEIAFASTGISLTGSTGNVLVGNTIHHHTSNGIAVWEASANPIRDNATYANDGHGIFLTGVSNTLLSRNQVHDNLGSGIFVDTFTSYPTPEFGNTFSQNEIYANGQLGIDLGGDGFGLGDGVTANDLNDADTGPNNLQNHPSIANVSSVGSNVRIEATLNSTPSTTFRIEFFASEFEDASGFGQGQVYLGSVDATTNGAGLATADFTHLGNLPFEYVTATATRLSTFDTSEFGPSFFFLSPVVPVLDPLIVTTTEDTIADDGLTSLREAMLYANSHAGHDTIRFNIPGTGVRTITITSELPTITEAVTIDGYTQSGAAPAAAGTPATINVRLDTTYGGGVTTGLTISSAGSTIRGLMITGFSLNGIHITGASATDNVIAGNWIGTDAVASLANFLGVFVENGATNNTIGGASVADRNIISGNLSSGIRIAGAETSNTTILGNFIGTKVVGTSALGNGGFGIEVLGSSNNTIHGNVLSANALDGVFLYNGADANVVQGNFIGTDVTGAVDLGNLAGVLIQDASNNQIGGTSASERNIISGNNNRGVNIQGTSSGNRVQGNYIGTDVTGMFALGNAFTGVEIAGSANNFIGGTASGAGNLISGNGHHGVAFFNSANANFIQGNLIGTDVTGTVALGNAVFGVFFFDHAHDNTIGGSAPGAGNVISGNASTGILLVDDGGNRIEGNRIGTDITGTLPLGNQGSGIELNGSSNNVIGGSSPGAGNLVSANRFQGIALYNSANDNFIQGNLIGTDESGMASLGNLQGGLLLHANASNNTIGGTTTGAGNVISGNEFHGVYLADVGTTGNIFQGNLIGTNATGTTALPNIAGGVEFDTASGNTLGGTAPGARNIISGNEGIGVKLDVSATGVLTRNIVQGNFIGTDITGAVAIANTARGVEITSAENVVRDNVISGNEHQGILIAMGGDDNVIQGNFIGTNASGNAALANLNSGISISGGASGNLIGGTDANARNIISGNKANGIDIGSAETAGNVVAGNYIGTNVLGAAAVNNVDHGVRIYGGAHHNLIGGTDAGAGNVISGNARGGIRIDNDNTADNRIEGNYIGTDATGRFAIESQRVLLNTTQTGAQLVVHPDITYFETGTVNGDALDFTTGTAGSTNFLYLWNLLTASGRGELRIEITIDYTPLTSDNDFIFGLTDGLNIAGWERSDNSSGSWFTRVGAYNGVNVPGFSSRPTGLGAVQPFTLEYTIARDAADPTIFRITEGARSHQESFSTFALDGDRPLQFFMAREGTGEDYRIHSVAVSIVEITEAIGVYVDNASGNIIGGTATGAGNLISGNTAEGVVLRGDDNRVQGNLIGTDATGLASVPNRLTGIAIFQGTGNQIGGASSAARNVIAGSSGADSVAVVHSTSFGNFVQGNYIGTDITGNTPLLVAAANYTGLAVGTDAHDNTIGGSAPGEGNVIVGRYDGINMNGAFANLVEGNSIGVSADGRAVLAGITQSGISLDYGSSDNILRNNNIANARTGIFIGSLSRNQILANSIHHNSVDGVAIWNAPNTFISGNSIFSNARHGILQLGSATLITNNSIHDNTATGILVDNVAGGPPPTGVTISQNSIFANGLLGIDLGGDGNGSPSGVTPNDLDDSDTGHNNLQNFPLITEIRQVGDDTVINALLNSVPNTTFRIEFFANAAADPSGFGEGEVYIGSVNVTSDAFGNAAGTFAHFGALPFGNLSVTATNLATGDTSEFGPNRFDPLVVTTTDDVIASDGYISLREAIEYANTHAGADTITFNIPGVGVQTINVVSNLPTITEALTIDGFTQGTAGLPPVEPSPFGSFPKIELSGASPSAIHGLHIEAADVTVRGLIINQFAGNGILISGSSATGVRVQGNYIGTDATGMLASPNLYGGIDIRDGASGNFVGTDGDGFDDASERNVLSGNLGTGVLITGAGSDGNVIAGNILGLDAAGLNAVPNGTWGVGINQGANTIVGGDLDVERNIISGNTEGGVFVIGWEAFGTLIQGNYIGTDVSGTLARGNGYSGIYIGDSDGFLIDGVATITGVASYADIHGNVVSGGNRIGIWIAGVGAIYNSVYGNFIGANAAGDADLGNLFDGIRIDGGAAYNRIGTDADGSDDAAEANLIRGNTWAGIAVLGAATIGNRIQGNSIFSNGGLGIDLDEDGVTHNDTRESHPGPNNLQNYPLITQVQTVGSDTVITASLHSTPDTDFRIEFFASASLDPSAHGEGQQFLGAVNVRTDAFGNAVAVFTGPTSFSHFSATATNVVMGNTSEFGPNLVDLFVVTTTLDTVADDGVTSLREAILYANSIPGIDTISFNIPGTGVQSIRPLTPLPAITDTVVIDGYTQPGARGNTNALDLGASAGGTNAVLLIEVDGSLQSTPSGLLRIGTLFSSGANNSIVRGLVLNGSLDNGIDVLASGTVLEGNFIGTDAAGASARPNAGAGVNIGLGAANVRIGGATPAARNLISGNLGQGIVTRNSGHTIQGNFIGTNAAGTADLGNANAGIDVTSEAASGGGFVSGEVMTLPQSALIPSTQYYTEQIGIGLGTPLIMTGGGGIGESRNDDGYSGPIELGFTLQFFGSEYTQFFANNNGNISFIGGISSYTPSGPQGANQPIISPFFADVDTRALGSGLMYLNTDIPNQIIITWDQVGYFLEKDDKLNSFQLVIRGPGYVVPPGEGSIGFFWKTMQWETGDASGGVDGFGGTPAAVGFGDGNSSGIVLDGSITNGIAAAVQNHRLWFEANLSPVTRGAADVRILGNLVSGNNRDGIRAEGMQDGLIQGNFIGTDLTGTSAIANGDLFSAGIQYRAEGGANSLLIGGPNAVDRNIISGNGGDGFAAATVSGSGHAITIQNNFIGLQADGASPLGNTRNGISYSSVGDLTGSTTVRDNRIAFNGLAGAAIGDATIRMTQNAIYSNSGLGIDRADPGVTADANLPFPVITSLVDGGTTLTLSGTLQGRSNTSYTLEFFANAARDPSAYGEGQTYLGSQVVTTDGSGFTAFTTTVANVVPAHLFVSGTATENGVNTFEFGPVYNAPPTISDLANQSGATGVAIGPLSFSVGDRETNPALLVVSASSDNAALIPNANIVFGGSGSNRTITVTPAGGQAGTAIITVTVIDAHGAISTDTFAVDIKPGFVVTNTNDSGPGSLRQAMLNANAHANTLNPGSVADRITFAIPGAGVQTINVLSAMPSITEGVLIDATSQTGFTNRPLVEVNGGSVGGTIDGLTIAANNVVISGLIINRFGGDGIQISGNDNVIVGNWIGLANTGLSGQGNGDSGVFVVAGSNNRIGGPNVADRNVIAGNVSQGVRVHDNISGTIVQGNYIGLDAAGNAAIANNGGVLLRGPNSQVLSNVLSGNTLSGLNFADLATNTTVKGNIIGLNAAGTQVVQNGDIGLFAFGANSTIGGTTATERNIISGNRLSGLYIDTTNITIQGNYVGTDIAGMIDLGNGGQGLHVQNANGTTTIGGLGVGQGNVFSGNGVGGIRLTTTANGVSIQGNYFGVNADNSGLLGNSQYGIRIDGSNTIVNGNTIAGNAFDGITLPIATATGNRLYGNTVYGNGGLGIDLSDDGVTLNDTGDADTGPNGRQNFPHISSVNGVSISGTLNSRANRTYRIELFSSTTAEAAIGQPQGHTFLGFVNATTNASGNATFNFTAPFAVSGMIVTATATDLTTNETSEFSHQLDFGDAPTPYPTTVAGAYATGVGSIIFGSDTTWTVTNASNVNVGNAQYVLQNLTAPTRRPAGATVFQPFNGGGWTADLSAIPNAYWIWAPGITSATTNPWGATYSFAKSFVLPSQPLAGSITIAADDFAQVYVNGTLAGQFGSVTDIGVAGAAQSVPTTFDISRFLVAGNNTITIVAQNGPFGGPTNYSSAPAGVVFGGVLAWPTGGARHLAITGPTLGATRDTEIDGQASDGADEDGVVFGSVFAVAGSSAGVTVNAPAGGRLDAWFDFNRDGDWSDPGEQIFVNRTLTNGTNALTFNVPSGVSVGSTWARFRISTAGGLGVAGIAADGEVEDYQVTVVAAANSAPIDLTLSTNAIAENNSALQVVGTFATNDPNAGDTHVYTLVSGAGATDNLAFTITGNQLKARAPFDFELKNSYSIRVRTTDQGGLSFIKVFTINVTDIVPQAQAQTVDATEDTAQIITLTAIPEPGQPVAFSIVSNPTRGSLTRINATQFRYQPFSNVYGADSFAFRASGAPNFDYATETGTPLGFYLDPSIGEGSVPDDLFQYYYTLLAGPQHGALSDPTGSGFATYTPNTGFVGYDSFTYEINDDGAYGFAYDGTFTVIVKVGEPVMPGTTATVSLNIANTPDVPTNVLLSSTSVPENAAVNAVVGTFTTIDPDPPATYTYQLISGAGSTHNSLFSISGDQLRANSSFDFEAGSTFSVRVRATDATGLFVDRAFTISVSNVNEAPTDILLDKTNVNGDGGINALVGNLTAVDPEPVDAHSYSLVAGFPGSSNSLFHIAGIQLRANDASALVTGVNYLVRLRAADDAGLFVDKSFTISVNNPPSEITLGHSSIPENFSYLDTIGLFTTNDPGDTHTYTLVPGDGADDNARFHIAGNQLRATGPFDYETAPSHTIRVRSTDQGGLFIERSFSITITDDVPTGVGLDREVRIPANLNADQLLALAVGYDEEPLTFQILSLDLQHDHIVDTLDTDGDGIADGLDLDHDEAIDAPMPFAFIGNQLRSATDLTGIVHPSDTVEIAFRAIDTNGSFVTRRLHMEVLDPIAAPTNLFLDNRFIADFSPAGTYIGSFFTPNVVPGESLTYQLVAGSGDEDNARFVIDESGNLATAQSLDGVTGEERAIRVRVSNMNGESFERQFIIVVTGPIPHGDSPPSPLEIAGPASGDIEVPEDTEVGTMVATLPETTTYDFGEDGLREAYLYYYVNYSSELFDLANNNQVVVAAPLDFESMFGEADVMDIYFEAVDSETNEVLDSGNFYFTIAITNVNETPIDVYLDHRSIPENAAAGDAVGTLDSWDPDGERAFTFTLLDDADGRFRIEGNQLVLADHGGALDFETQSDYVIVVQAEDGFGATVSREFTIAVTNVNEAPYEVALSADTVPTHRENGTVVGVIGPRDFDRADAFTFDLLDSAGGRFRVSPDGLLEVARADLLSAGEYAVTVGVHDAGGESVTETFTIYVDGSSASPDSLDLAPNRFDENLPPNTLVGSFTSTDPDADDSAAYSLVPGVADNSLFTLVGDMLYFNGAADYEVQATYTIYVRVTDSTELSLSKYFTINVNDVNETPRSLALSNTDRFGRLAVDENVLDGFELGHLSGIDPDGGDTLRFALISGYGDNNKVSIQGNVLSLNVSPDFETQQVYDIRIAAIDRGGLRFERTFEINIRDLNDGAPELLLYASRGGIESTAVNGSRATLYLVEDTPPRSVIATLGVRGQDAGNTIVLRLVDDAGGRFVLVGNVLMVAPGFELDLEPLSQFTLRLEGVDQHQFANFWSVDVVLSNAGTRRLETAALDQAFLNAGKQTARIVSFSESTVEDSTVTTVTRAKADVDNGRQEFEFVSTDANEAESAFVDSEDRWTFFGLADARPSVGELPWSSRVLDHIVPDGNDSRWLADMGLNPANQGLTLPLSGVSNLLESGDGVRYFSEALRHHAPADVFVSTGQVHPDPAPPVSGNNPPVIDGEFEAANGDWAATFKKAIIWIAVPVAASAVVLCSWLGLRKKKEQSIKVQS